MSATRSKPNRPSFAEVMAELDRQSDPTRLAGMARYRIDTSRARGISIPILRRIASRTGRDHRLAARLWASNIHEARMLAGMVDEPDKVRDEQMERWVRQFRSWDLCDQCCSNLFDKTPHALQKAVEWSARDEEFMKRAGFVLMACMAVHDKTATDSFFLRFLPLIKRESNDGRNFVKKAVNWALRQIGKRNARLRRAAIATAREILALNTPAGRWIATDALRELTH